MRLSTGSLPKGSHPCRPYTKQLQPTRKLAADLWVRTKIEKMIDIVPTMSYITIVKIFKWNTEKNEVLARERGITFEEIVKRIESGAKTLEMDHPNKKKYPNQKILIIDVDGYAYLVPCIIDKNDYFLKTIIPSRKATKKYLGGKNG